MHQKDLARKAWEQAGLYRTQDAKLLSFLKHFDQSAIDCWTELAEVGRGKYARYKAQLVTPLWETGDKLMRLNLLRLVDVNNREELELVLRVVDKCDPEEDRQELRAMAQLPNKQIRQIATARADMLPSARK